MPIPWEAIAKQKGFEDSKAMLKAFYPKFTIHQLSARFGCSVAALRRQLDLAGIDIRGRGGAQKSLTLDKVTVAEYHTKGARTLAQEYGCDVTSVYKHFRKLGVRPARKEQPGEQPEQSGAESAEGTPDQSESQGSPSPPTRQGTPSS